jgi:catechol 2,3-dioxygenase-like lactoylglutathione lyase family enzyme
LIDEGANHATAPVLTLGVDDLERAVTFYRDGLGLKTDGIVGTEFEYGAVAFFDLQAGLKLALWPRISLAMMPDFLSARRVRPTSLLGIM